MSDKKFDWGEWLGRLVITLLGVAEVALFVWLATIAYRNGEDEWGSVAVALALLRASLFSDHIKEFK